MQFTARGSTLRIRMSSNTFATAYLDDLIVFRVLEDHLVHLTDIFNCLEGAGLTAKLSKCQFAMHQCI